MQQIPSPQLKWKVQKFPLVVIAENMHSPANVGMAMRVCEAFGVSSLYFTGPYANTSSEKFRKAARSAQKYLDIYEGMDTISVMQSYVAQGFKVLALEITDKSSCLSKYKWGRGEKVVLIIGSERHGVNDLTLKLVDESIHIQQYGRTGSLNVGTALSVALYELTKQMMTDEEDL